MSRQEVLMAEYRVPDFDLTDRINVALEMLTPPA
jgi:hypothetical protein